MRQSKLTADEIQAAEKAADERRRSRDNGFSLMSIRDRGWVRLETGQILEWHTDRPLYEGEARQHVPEGHIMIDAQLFNVDEFQKFLRWS